MSEQESQNALNQHWKSYEGKTICNENKEDQFTFDRVYGEESTTEEIYNDRVI